MWRQNLPHHAEVRMCALGELKTTFASSFNRTIGLEDVIHPDMLQSAPSKSTGQKLLVNPTIG